MVLTVPSVTALLFLCFICFNQMEEHPEKDQLTGLASRGLQGSLSPKPKTINP